MKRLITDDPEQVGNYVADKLGTTAKSFGVYTAIGVADDSGLIGGTVFNRYNGVNVWPHWAGEQGVDWMSKYFLACCFHYMFVKLGCVRITGAVDASNIHAMDVDLRLGFKPEAVLKGAAADGGDINLLVMWKSDAAKWLALGGRYGLQQNSPASTPRYCRPVILNG